MADQWLYRVFGQDFGPISFEELQTLADIGILSASDEVRLESAAGWAIASSIPQLGLKGSAIVAVAVDTDSTVPPKSTGVDEWYCQMLGQELGPLSFSDLVGYAEQGQVTADDLVKLGSHGKWRRVGSIGRLVAVLPYLERPASVTHAPKTSADSVDAGPSESVNVAPSVTPPSAEQLAELQDAELALTKAEAACAPMIQVAQHHMSWAFSPGCDPAWWVSINSVIEGPVTFTQLVDWAIAGKLRPIDYLCQGRFGQYLPAGLVVGLFQAANLLKSVSEALNAAKSRVAAARAAIPAVASLPVSNIAQAATSSAAPVETRTPETRTETAAPSKPEIVSNDEQPSRSIAAEASDPPGQPAIAASLLRESRFPSAAFGNSPMSRPTPMVPAPRAHHSSDRSASASLWERIMSSGRNLAIIAAVLTLIIGGGVYWSGGAAADVRRYYALKEILDEVHSLREKKSTNFSALKRKAVKVGSTTAKTLERQRSTRPSAKFLLRAARDELPRMIYGDLSVETPAEQKFVSQLSEAAKALGLKS